MSDITNITNNGTHDPEANRPRSVTYTRMSLKTGRPLRRRPPELTTEEEDMALAAEFKRFGPDPIWKKGMVRNLKIKIQDRLGRGNRRPLAFLAREEAAILS